MITTTHSPNRSTDPAWRRSVSTRIRAVCRSEALFRLLDPWSCGPFDGGCLMVAAALQHALGGELCGVMGYPLTPHGAPTVWQHAVVRIGSNAYADGDGISVERSLRQRWLRQESTIVCGFAPMPPQAEWPSRYPDTPYDPATAERMADLFSEELARCR